MEISTDDVLEILIGFLMSDILVLVVGAAVGFIAAVVQRTYESRRKCYADAVRIASQFMDSEGFLVTGSRGKAERPSSLEINRVFSELLIYCGRNSSLPEMFMGFFSESDGDKVLNELWPNLIRKVRKELWIVFSPKIPEKVLFRWQDEM